MKRGRVITVLRHVVQVAVLLLFAVLGVLHFATGIILGEGVFFGTLSSSSVTPLQLVLTDPYAALQVMIASRSVTVTLVLGAVAALVFYGLIKGRAFCGWVCPLGLVTEVADFIGRKTGLSKREPISGRMPPRSKVIAALLVLLASGMVGLPVFELFSPISTITKAMVLGTGLGLWVLVAVVLMELFFPDHLWCRRLCPLGGFYEAIGPAGIVRVRMREGCTSCMACKKVCLADERILDPVIEGRQRDIVDGDCLLCGRCIEACPTRALRFAAGVPFAAGRASRKEAGEQ